MDRIQQNQPGVLTAYWERDGEPADPGTVTVAITRDSDGTAVTTGSAVGEGAYRTFALTSTQTLSLDKFTILWTGSDGSLLKTYAEIVGGFLFTVARARTRSPLQDTDQYPTESILYYRTLAEIALEDICAQAFVPRYSRSVAKINGAKLFVPRRKVTKVVQITTATDQGPQALPTLAGVRILNGGVIWMPNIWSWFSLPITVAYEHGVEEADPRVARAALELARRWLVESPWDERMTGYRQRDGGELSILTANNRDPFDLPEVVAVSEIYGTPMIF